MDKEHIKKALDKYVHKNTDGRPQIECADAYKVAYALNMKIAEVAQAIHDNDIKILKCQLGCF